MVHQLASSASWIVLPLATALVGCSNHNVTVRDSGSATDARSVADGQTTQDSGVFEAGAALFDGGTDAIAVDQGEGDPLPNDCARPPERTECLGLSYTTLPAAGSYGSPGPNSVEVLELDHPARDGRKVTAYFPGGSSGVPVIFFSHAYGAESPSFYQPLFEQLAQNGIAVIFSPYATILLGADSMATRYEQLWQGFKAAADLYQDRLDLTRVGFAGHSFGAGATPEMGRRGFVEQGWGSNGRFLFIMAPWYSWGQGYDQIPADTRVIIQVYWEDETNDHRIAEADIWNKLPAAVEKRWQVVFTDTCGECSLVAGHSIPVMRQDADSVGAKNNGNLYNGHDLWVVMRRIHAFAAYAFYGDQAGKAVAYADQGTLGNWTDCDQRSVTPLRTLVKPWVSPCDSSQWMFSLSSRCDFADDGTPGCP